VKTLLTPVFVNSPAQQVDFYRRFEVCLTQRSAGLIAPPKPDPKPPNPESGKRRLWWRLIAGCALVVILGVGTWLALNGGQSTDVVREASKDLPQGDGQFFFSPGQPRKNESAPYRPPKSRTNSQRMFSFSQRERDVMARTKLLRGDEMPDASYQRVAVGSTSALPPHVRSGSAAHENKEVDRLQRSKILQFFADQVIIRGVRRKIMSRADTALSRRKCSSSCLELCKRYIEQTSDGDRRIARPGKERDCIRWRRCASNVEHD
jgi:hypothetical protein